MKTLTEACATFRTPRNNPELCSRNMERRAKFECIAVEIANHDEVAKIIKACAEQFGIELTCESEDAGEICEHHKHLRLLCVSLFANGVRCGIEMERNEDFVPGVIA